MKTYNIWGKFTVDVDFNIEAENEMDAEKKARQMIKDRYNLDAIGDLHVKNNIEFQLNIDEEDE